MILCSCRWQQHRYRITRGRFCSPLLLLAWVKFCPHWNASLFQTVYYMLQWKWNINWDLIMEWCLEPGWGASSGSWAKTLLLSLLVFFTEIIVYSVITVVHHIHFRPVGTSLFVSTRFIFTNSFAAFLLRVILDFVIKAVLSISVEVASRSISGLIWSRSVVLAPGLGSFLVPLVL